MKRLSTLLAIFAAASAVVVFAATRAGPNVDEDAIRGVIGSAYIGGLHLNGSREDIRRGFHPEFVMSVRTEEGVQRVGIEEWIGRLPPEGTDVGHAITYDIPTVTRTGNAAVATVEVQFDGKHVFTDYMGLYRFPEGWRIVNKIFQAH